MQAGSLPAEPPGNPKRKGFRFRGLDKMSHKALWALKLLKFYDQFDTDKLVRLDLEKSIISEGCVHAC